jgi:hypothetical protein
MLGSKRRIKNSKKDKKDIERSKISEALDSKGVDLTLAIDAVKVLDALELPLFEQILIIHLCKDLNCILQSNSKTENLQLFRRIFYKVKEIKRRRPYWKLNYAFRKFSYLRRKMKRERRTTLTQKEAEELARFEEEREILDKIQVEKSFLENLHLFQTIQDHRLQKGKRMALSL